MCETDVTAKTRLISEENDFFIRFIQIQQQGE